MATSWSEDATLSWELRTGFISCSYYVSFGGQLGALLCIVSLWDLDDHSTCWDTAWTLAEERDHTLELELSDRKWHSPITGGRDGDLTSSLEGKDQGPPGMLWQLMVPSCRDQWGNAVPAGSGSTQQLINNWDEVSNAFTLWPIPSVWSQHCPPKVKEPTATGTQELPMRMEKNTEA